MAVLLGGLVFGFITIGFTLISVVPLLFGVMLYATFREQFYRKSLAAAGSMPDIVAVPMSASESRARDAGGPDAGNDAETRESQRSRTAGSGRT